MIPDLISNTDKQIGEDVVIKMKSAINSHQNDTTVRGMGHHDTGNHLNTIVSCEDYPFCACDLE